MQTNRATSVDRITKAIVALVKVGYADELPVASAVHAWRADGDEHIGARINDAGRIAIGVDPVSSTEGSLEQPAVRAVTAGGAGPSKTQVVLTLLKREQGATLAELIEATGWLPHTTRAALTGIRKKGYELMKGKRDDVTCYTCMMAAC